ncbi:hypothetical protein HanIR_Chr05g0216731 [Helianthus annuus]|nr:hypothetical protein HanIR_Chr05g0216731 [Helianthus annuus]
MPCCIQVETLEETSWNLNSSCRSCNSFEPISVFPALYYPNPQTAIPGCCRKMQNYCKTISQKLQHKPRP